MKSLISNSLNEKSVINNILARSLNKLILLEGRYGTGKSEFAKQIARMITCKNLTTSGYCNECDSCNSEFVYGINSINVDIHFLNMQKVQYSDMVTLVNQCVNKIRTNPEVYIFDEFHLLDKSSQELWLAETSRLEDCYLIMTTTDKKSVADGIISRSIQLPMKMLAPLECKALMREHYHNISNTVSEAIIKKIGGCPRELISMSQFYANSGMTDDEIHEHLSNVNQSEIVLLLEALKNRELFFDRFRTVRTLSSYTVKTVLQDLMWDYLGSTEVERKALTHFSEFSEKQIIRFLSESNVEPFLALMSMFKAVNVRMAISPQEEEGVSPTDVESARTSTESIQRKSRW
jgi:DNA polymerase III gamma/tau subunit